MVSPGRLSWTLKLDAFSGEIVAHRRKFRFSADVAIKVDVTLHPRIRRVEPEPNPEPKPVRVPAVDKTRARFLPTKNEWVIGGTFVVGVVLVATASTLLLPAGVAAAAGTAAFGISTGTLDILRRKRVPRRHVIDTNDPKLRS